MATLADCKLAHEVVLLDGKRTLKDSIIDRQEFECAVPSEFPVVLGCIVRGSRDETLAFTVDVLSHMERPIGTRTKDVKFEDTGSIEIFMEISIPVLDVRPCYVLLKFDNVEVWRQRIFFARPAERLAGSRSAILSPAQQRIG